MLGKVVHRDMGSFWGCEEKAQLTWAKILSFMTEICNDAVTKAKEINEVLLCCKSGGNAKFPGFVYR